MKQKRKIIEVIILAIFLVALAGFCSKSEEMAKAELYENGVYQQESRNLYFFEEETERVSYQLDYNFYNDFSGVADLIITKVRELEDGEVYGEWKVVEYLGSAVEYHDAEPEIPEEKQAAEDYDSSVKEQYLGTSIYLTEENIEYFAAPCELGYYYEDYSDLFFLYRQPATMNITPPFTCADISLKDMEDSISVIRDGDNTVVVCVKGNFFRIEKAKVYLEAVSNYFCSNIPELDTYSEYISRESEGNAQLTVQVFDDEDGYMVYVGEQWADHSVNWDWFFVRADLSEVYYYDLMDDEYWTIEEWRASERYRDLE